MRRPPPVPVLLALLFLLAFSPPGASEGPRDPDLACSAAPGWWVAPDGTRLFAVDPNSISILDGALPSPACGSVVFQGLQLGAPPCVARAEQPCQWRVEIVFVTPTSGILSAQRFGVGTGVCTDTCSAWDAVPVHPGPSPVTPSGWGLVKQRFH